ncbi:MAG: ATP-binding cassette domain-containing protein, partial [Pseudomonadota bacterium]|nr:ATP-binding cassette domain-containing protein [Pseudomonadota bacterium]
MNLPSASPLLQLDRVSRRLAGREIVREVSFSLNRGDVLGLLGVNGAGKSTTLAMIAGVLAPSSGMVRVEGCDLHETPELARTRIGYLPENVPLWPELTVCEYLDACGRLRGMARA